MQYFKKKSPNHYKNILYLMKDLSVHFYLGKLSNKMINNEKIVAFENVD